MHPPQTAPGQVMDRPWQVARDDLITLAEVQDSGHGQGCADLVDDLTEGAARQRQISLSLQTLATGFVRDTASLFTSPVAEANHWQREVSQTLEKVHNSGTVRARARQFETPISPNVPRSMTTGRMRTRRFVALATEAVETVQCITEEEPNNVKTTVPELEAVESDVAAELVNSDAVPSVPMAETLTKDCDEGPLVPESPILPTTERMRHPRFVTVATEAVETLECITEEEPNQFKTPVLKLQVVESDVAAELVNSEAMPVVPVPETMTGKCNERPFAHLQAEEKIDEEKEEEEFFEGNNRMPVECFTMTRSVTERKYDDVLESDERPTRSCSAPALTHFYRLDLDDVASGMTSRMTSSSLSECGLSVDAAEISIWGEVFVSRIQAWFRGRAERCKAEALAHGLAAAREQQELSLQNDMEQFANGGLPEAFQERVQTRAYYSFLNGCLDEKKNYFDAFRVELELACTASRVDWGNAALGA